MGGLTLATGSIRALDRSEETKHWMWMRWRPNSKKEEWQSLLARARRNGIDAVLPEVYNSKNALYVSDHLPMGERWLDVIASIAREEGLELHAWMWMMPCNIDSVRMEHPTWFAVNRNGESASEKPAYVDYYKFLCPSNPDVHSFLRSNVSEMAGFPGVKGVHLDYIRYPDVILAKKFQAKYGIVQDKEYPAYDYCYCETCAEAFASKTGRDLRKIDDPSGDAEWRQFRYDRITALVNNILVPAVRDRHKMVTAAVFPNWESVRQQWTSWNVDGFLPMLYHGFYDQGIDWIGEQTAWGVGKLNGRAPLYAGLFVQHLEPDVLSKAIDVSMKSGAAGVSLFNAEDMTDEHWKQLKSSVMR